MNALCVEDQRVSNQETKASALLVSPVFEATVRVRHMSDDTRVIGMLLKNKQLSA